MATLLAIEPPPAARLAEITANFEVKLKSVLQKAEAATVKRALHTWQELQGAIAAAGGGLPDKHLLATFIREHASPTRAYTALGWLVRNLKLPFDLSEVVKPRAGLGSRLGQGQAQAATLEPSMESCTCWELWSPPSTTRIGPWCFAPTVCVLVW